MKKVAVGALFAFLVAGALAAEDIRIVVPYLGAATDVYKDDAKGIDLTDTRLMEGLYLQWVNPELFQANVFVYHSADINYSQLWGVHLIGDVYVWSDPLGKAALGAGLDMLRLDMDAGDNIVPLKSFELPMTLYAPYVRAGHYFNFGSGGMVSLSVLPWAGAEYDITRGDLSFVPPGPPMTIKQSIDDETLYGLAGINAGAVIMHFIEIQAKYRATFNEDDYLNTFDAMLNFYLNRHWGVSYRFKYMETTSGSVSYHIGGIAYVF